MSLLPFYLACEKPKINEFETVYSFGESILGITTVADGLDWDIVWGPDGNLWFTEQAGRISSLNVSTNEITQHLVLEDTYRMRTSGLLGIALHVSNEGQFFVFVAYTAKKDEETRVSRVMRYTKKGDSLDDPHLILEYPAWSGHFGARVVVSPDGKLLVATGDGAQHENAQNWQSPNGKILRFNLDGTIPDDNPELGSPVWASGLRNPQGLDYSDKGILYVSDHGDATDDEVNLIGRQGNYGWPNVEGFIDREDEIDFASEKRITEPLVAWTPTIAPAGIAFYGSGPISVFNNSLLLATLKGSSLRVLKLNALGNEVVADSVLFTQAFGRLRSVCVAPNGDVYVGTSNRDWNPFGFAKENDDRIIRISHVDRLDDRTIKPAVTINSSDDVVSRGESLYLDYCSSCHKPNGTGVENIFPSLLKAPLVNSPDKISLIDLVLKGKGEMPSFGFLSNEDLAIVMTYIRKRFGPQASPLTENEVQHQRQNASTSHIEN
ncbi:PQQ-dependent sugar dehydrogenase [Lunatibacter salilacus]|uniref:PQQ-dependent sugar dehydrogenase n=1 Tax=Lunatibacter salilacus TaxID=2483804 RepID=UPI001F2051A8|nr:PQQ-dependent sugar dehydrogenase [Lunatibacter salilacus]